MADHTLTATATDSVGNTARFPVPWWSASTPARRRHRVRRISRRQLIQARRAATISPSVAAATYTGTAEAGSTVTLFDGASSVGQAVATGGSYTITSSTAGRWRSYPRRPPRPTRPQHRHGLKLAGRHPVDTSAPNAPSAPDLIAATDSGSSSTDNLTNVAAATYTGTAEAGSTVTPVRRRQLGRPGRGKPAPATPSHSSALSDGAHTLTAKATDAAGNTGAASGALVRHHRHFGTQCSERPRPDRSIGLGRVEHRQSHQRRGGDLHRPRPEAGSTVTLFDGASSVGQAVATAAATPSPARRWPMAIIPSRPPRPTRPANTGAARARWSSPSTPRRRLRQAPPT